MNKWMKVLDVVTDEALLSNPNQNEFLESLKLQPELWPSLKETSLSLLYLSHL